MIRGTYNKDCPIEEAGILGARNVHYNLLEANLVEASIKRGEAALGQGGALLVETGKFTGRSPNDKFIVDEPSVHSEIWWENNQAMDASAFEALKTDMFSFAAGKDLFVQDLFAGADLRYRMNIRQIHEYAWHNLFIRHLLRRPEREELDHFFPDFTLLNLPSFRADPKRHGCNSDTVIATSFEQKLILIGGTSYAGENKKSIFGVLNYVLPPQGVFPMHCSANHSIDDPSDTTIFFGLSGTGKTTLSSDRRRVLLGDDEHGWSDNSCFNFEGGCYAKTISLDAEAEPDIHAATSRFGSVIENMVYDPESKALDFEDDSLTANMRCAYPLEAISNVSETGVSGTPKNVVMLTCDAFGVLPPIARLTPAQAMYYFMSGFTSKLAGTERGLIFPEPTFSTCFGAPFLPRRPQEYGAMLRKKLADKEIGCWMVNTGWTGGAVGEGMRMPLAATRALLNAAMDGSLNQSAFRKDPNFGFDVPLSCEGVDAALLDPRGTWKNPQDYDEAATKLRDLFAKNFEQYVPFVDDDVMCEALNSA